MGKGSDIDLVDAVVHFRVANGHVKAVDHITTTFKNGKITGLIGESGCGKSVLGMYILGLLPSYAKTEGKILYGGHDLCSLNAEERRQIRGRILGLIPQNPGDSLNPSRRVRGQIGEALALLKRRRTRSYEEEEKEGLPTPVDMLERYGFTREAAERVALSYPFQLSGGMQQRCVVAMGTASDPEWILADEPSKGLDMTLREQLYDTLRAVREQNTEKGMLIITHDLVLADTLCDEIAVMYAGQIMEKGENVLHSPLHPYTKGILASLPENGMHPMKGIAPSPGDILPGCRFAPRCPFAREECGRKEPEEIDTGNGKVRCYLYA